MEVLCGGEGGLGGLCGSRGGVYRCIPCGVMIMLSVHDNMRWRMYVGRCPSSTRPHRSATWAKEDLSVDEDEETGSSQGQPERTRSF